MSESSQNSRCQTEPPKTAPSLIIASATFTSPASSGGDGSWPRPARLRPWGWKSSRPFTEQNSSTLLGSLGSKLFFYHTPSVKPVKQCYDNSHGNSSFTTNLPWGYFNTVMITVMTICPWKDRPSALRIPLLWIQKANRFPERERERETNTP